MSFWLKSLRALSLIIIFFLTATPAYALEVNQPFYNLGGEIEYLIDNTGDLEFKQILRKENTQLFISAKQKKLGSLSPNTVLWLKIRLHFTPESPGNRYKLSMVGTDYREITIFRPDSTGRYNQYITGNLVPAAQRETRGGGYAFNIDKNIEHQTIYVRVISGSNISLSHWLLMTESRFINLASKYKTFNFLSLGALLGIMLFSAGIGATLRNINYFYYSAYIFSGLALLMTLDGNGYYWLWPHNPDFNLIAIHVFTFAVAYFRLMTIYGFLEIQTLSSTLGQLTRYWIIFLTLLLIGAFLGLFNILNSIVTGGIWGASILFGLLLMVYAIIKKAPLAKTIFFVLLIPLIGSIMQVLSVVGIFDLGAGVTLLAKACFLIHALLFSIIIARRIKFEELSARAAQYDDLTGLENFELTTANFKQATAMARRYRWNILVMFIDLDKFKPVNDSYGHEVGDLLLQQVSSRIKACMRNVDFICRIGGDEFLVIETQSRNPQRVKLRAEKMVVALSQPFFIQGHSIEIGASIGIAEYPKDGEQLEELMHAADQAMYQVKNAGRNGVAIAE